MICSQTNFKEVALLNLFTKTKHRVEATELKALACIQPDARCVHAIQVEFKKKIANKGFFSGRNLRDSEIWIFSRELKISFLFLFPLRSGYWHKMPKNFFKGQ